MVRGDREDYRAEAIESVFRAYDELSQTIGRSEGAPLDDIQAAVEHLLDAVKVAEKTLYGSSAARSHSAERSHVLGKASKDSV
jgi:2-keto-3-deoxy-L-rhamnonate aldolase RhmA